MLVTTGAAQRRDALVDALRRHNPAARISGVAAGLHLVVKLQQLKMQLRMTINAILDQLVHCEDLPEAEAMALMTGRGFQEEGEAAGKWRRALLTSTQLSTYFVGYTEVAGIAALRPAGTWRGTTRCWPTARRHPATCARCRRCDALPVKRARPGRR